METSLTKADRLADAKTVRGYREALAGGGRAAGPPAAANALAGSTASQRSTALAGASALPVNPAALLALKDGYTNTLGMKFLPVKGTDVMFCIHETRYKDYAAYAADAPGVDGWWKDQDADGFTPTENKEDHPVMKVSWEDAQKFCAWLQKQTSILARHRLRLPLPWGEGAERAAARWCQANFAPGAAAPSSPSPCGRGLG
ncbi:MAG: formylglycine-generating enzyme family protein [Verrucomicrobiaceae bacterium]|nr:formylglycine-generating enzyme family protein [Verrucomicrobiaceae bacterium]